MNANRNIYIPYLLYLVRRRGGGFNDDTTNRKAQKKRRREKSDNRLPFLRNNNLPIKCDPIIKGLGQAVIVKYKKKKNIQRAHAAVGICGQQKTTTTDRKSTNNQQDVSYRGRKLVKHKNKQENTKHSKIYWCETKTTKRQVEWKIVLTQAEGRRLASLYRLHFPPVTAVS